MRRVLLAVFMLGATVAHAGEVDGAVVDALTLKPVPGAVVKWSSGKQAVTANAVGRFRVKNVEGALTLRASADGYISDFVKLDVSAMGITKATILLYAEGATETIEIGGEPPLEPVAPGTQQLSRKELTRIPGTRGDALTAIKSLPGVGSIDAQGASAGTLVIRGAAPEDTRVAIDGIEVPLLYHFFGLQSIIPSELIESIDFQPGGFGVKYGRATGGYINITTRADDATDWSGFAELSFINLAGFVSGPVWEKQNVFVTAGIRRSTIDLILPAVLPDDADISFTTAPQYYDSQLRLDWLPKPAHRVSLLGLLSYDLLTLLNDNVLPNEPAFQGEFDNETSFTRAIATWKYEKGSVANRFVTSVGTTGFRVEVGNDRFLRINSKRWEARNDFVWRPFKQLNIRTGGEAIVDNVDLDIKFPLPPQEGSGGPVNFSTAPLIELDRSQSANFFAFYAAADVMPLKGLTVSPGFRTDYYGTISQWTFEPRLAIEQNITKDLALKTSVGLYARPLDGPESLQSNLDPETAVQLVTGTSYNISNGISASGNLFYTWRQDLIVQDPTLAELDPEASYVNRGSGRSYGAEMLLRFKKDRYFGWVSYTLSRSDRFDGPNAPRRLFDFDQTHLISALGSVKLGKWELGARWQYSTGQPITPVARSIYLSDLNVYIPEFGDINSARLPAGHQLDVRIDRKFTFDNWALELYLDVTNVYLNPRTLGVRYNFDYTKQESIKELPILPALGVRGTF